MGNVTTKQALSFLENALRNWDSVVFDQDDLEDVRDALQRFTRQSQEPLMEVLREAREAIASAPEDAFGYGAPAFCSPEEAVANQWPLRDELLSKLDAILSGEVDRG